MFLNRMDIQAVAQNTNTGEFCYINQRRKYISIISDL
jgi:hypothetical protein